MPLSAHLLCACRWIFASLFCKRVLVLFYLSTLEDYGAGVQWRHCEGNAKLTGYDFWASLGSPKFVLAPMVEGSDLPYRELTRRYGAQLTYAPMLNSGRFAADPKYRAREFTTSREDKPLFVQFCANDPVVLLQAAKYVEWQCDAVDINFGCPQNIAKRGHYGAFLQVCDASLVHTCG